MRTWTTFIYARCAETNEMTKFCGPNIQAPTKSLAHKYCQKNGLGYLHISYELVMEIPCKDNGSPDWGNAIDYDSIQRN
jgi:hypothetical protein